MRMSSARESALRALWGTDEFLDTTGSAAGMTSLVDEKRSRSGAWWLGGSTTDGWSGTN